MSTPAPAPTVNEFFNSIVALFSNRNVHKLAGTALASGALVVGNKFDVVVGAVYAAIMHLTGGIKQLPD